MKKVFSTLVALGLALSVFTGCQDPVTYSFNANTDELITLETPSIDGKAFYGYNYIFWSDVNCDHYELYRTAPNGTSVKLPILNPLCYKDTDVSNEGTYKYTIKACPATDVARGFVSTASKTASVEMEAKIPSIKGAKDNVFTLGGKLDSGNVNVDYDLETGKVFVNFKAKTWLNYRYAFLDDLQVEKGDFENAEGMYEYIWQTPYLRGSADQTKTDEYDAQFEFNLTGWGSKNLYIKANMPAYSYIPTAYTEKLIGNNIEIPELKVSTGTSNLVAKFVDKDSLDVKVSWTPAKDRSFEKKEFAIENYSVYKYTKGVYSKFEGEIKVQVKPTVNYEDSTYYIIDTLENKEDDVSYYVVLKDETKYGEEKKVTLSKDYNNAAAGTISATTYIDDNTSLANNIKVTYTTSSSETGTVKVWYSVDGGDYQVLEGFELASKELDDTNVKYVSIALKDQKPGVYDFVAVYSDEGCKDTVKSVPAKITIQDPEVLVNNNLRLDKSDISYLGEGKYKIALTIFNDDNAEKTPLDATSNYTFKFEKGEKTYNYNGYEDVGPTWKWTTDTTKSVTFEKNDKDSLAFTEEFLNDYQTKTGNDYFDDNPEYVGYSGYDIYEAEIDFSKEFNFKEADSIKYDKQFENVAERLTITKKGIVESSVKKVFIF